MLYWEWGMSTTTGIDEGDSEEEGGNLWVFVCIYLVICMHCGGLRIL